MTRILSSDPNQTSPDGRPAHPSQGTSSQLPLEGTAGSSRIGQDSFLFVFAAPALFVVLWSTGFIGAKLGLPYVEPMTFLFVRYLLVIALFVPIALIFRARWPKTPAAWAHILVVGVLLHAGYLGGVFWGISQGVSAGVSAVIVGVQPILTAILAGLFLGERLSRIQWLGLALGFGGVALVVGQKISVGEGTLAGYIACVLALFGITIGTLYQKRFCADMDLRSGSAIQFAAAAAVLGVLALATETMEITWHPDLIIAMSWLVIMLSLGAVSLLLILIRAGAASRVASLFYLVPPCTAVFAYFLFDEQLGLGAFAGMIAAVIGVALVLRGGPSQPRLPEAPAKTS